MGHEVIQDTVLVFALRNWRKSGITPGWTAGVLADITAMQLSKKYYCRSQLSQSRHTNILPPECGMSAISPSVLWKRKPDCDVEYCTNWSAGTGVTLLMVSQYVMLQTHTMLPVSNSRGTHGLSASPESNIWKWYLIHNDVTLLFHVSSHSSNVCVCIYINTHLSRSLRVTNIWISLLVDCL